MMYCWRIPDFCKVSRIGVRLRAWVDGIFGNLGSCVRRRGKAVKDECIERDGLGNRQNVMGHIMCSIDD